MKLRNRLTLTFTVITLAALFLSFVIVFVLVRRDELRELDDALFAQAESTANFVVMHERDRPGLPAGPAEIPEALDFSPRYVALYGPKGVLRAHNAGFGDRAPPDLASLGIQNLPTLQRVPVEFVLGSDTVRGVVIPLNHEGKLLLYAVSRRSVDADLHFLLRVCSALALVSSLVTYLVARWLGRTLAGDVAAIARVAGRVAEGDLSARVGPQVVSSVETRGLAHDLDHMISQLGTLMNTQRTFIAHAAHELRSPLASLRGELQLALRRPREASGYRDAIETALSEVDALAALSEDLLQLARLQSVGISDSSEAALRDVVEDAMRMARGPAEVRTVTLNVSLVPEVRVRGTQTDLARALRNLIDNAVAHTPESKSVHVTVLTNHARTEVAVEDEGDGVREEDIPYIFDPFWRGTREQGEETRGSGLGLAIAREIARACAGDIEVVAKGNSGARFTMILKQVAGPHS